MITVDTNIIVRMLTGDEPKQFKKAKNLFEKEDIYIPTTVILETEWVLRYAYKFDVNDIYGAFNSLFGLTNVTLEEPLGIFEILEWYRKGIDFADAIHLGKAKGTDYFATFDKALIKAARKHTKILAKAP